MKQLSLRDAREQHDPPLTQEQLEALSGVNQATISAIERGTVTNPTNTTVKNLEQALKLERGTLRFESTDAEKQTRLPLKTRAS